MRRIQLGLLAGSMCALLCVAVAGCGVVDRDDEPLTKKKGKAGAGPSIGPVAALKPVPGKYEGVITGVVKWDGAKPNLEAMTKQLRDSMKSDPDYCLTGKKPGDSVAVPIAACRHISAGSCAPSRSRGADLRRRARRCPRSNRTKTRRSAPATASTSRCTARSR